MTHDKKTKAGANVAGYVLVGGASSRFGEDKAFAKLAGIPMLEYMIDVLIKATGEAFIVGGVREKHQGFDADIIPDRWPGEGPLGGIITALEVSARSPGKSIWNLIVSCDMPFLTREWLTYLCERTAASQAEVVVPQSAQGLEPLCACWKTDAGPSLRSAFENGVRKVTEAMKQIRVEVLDEKDWKRFDSAGRLFWNMNTPQDYQDALKVFAEERR